MHIKKKTNKGWTTSRSNNLNFYSTVGSYVPLYEVATSPPPRHTHHPGHTPHPRQVMTVLFERRKKTKI